jgi:hypothetical protein
VRAIVDAQDLAPGIVDSAVPTWRIAPSIPPSGPSPSAVATARCALERQDASYVTH